MSIEWQSLAANFMQAMTQMRAMTAWESVAVLLAIAYLALAMRENIWCWPAAFFSTAIYTVLFWEVSLLMESALQVYYMGMAVYGWWMWNHGGNKSKRNEGVQLVSWSWHTHLKLIAVTTLLSLTMGWFMTNYTQASFAYLDAATTCFAVITTFLVAKKVVENWLYWVVIDIVSIYLYLSKGLMLTSLLFVLYVVMATVGYFMWRRDWKKQQLPQVAIVKPCSVNL